jgi:hypothetical protein
MPIPLFFLKGDGKLNDRKNVILSFRVTQDEKKLIEKKALSSYRLVSMYLRDCALDKKITVIDGLKETEIFQTCKNLFPCLWTRLSSIPIKF